MLNDEILLEISIIEVLLIIFISSIGAIIHETLECSINKKKLTDKRVILNIVMTVLIVSIISITIDPFIITINPRLILLPPLIMSLLGTELIFKLIHLRSSLKLISFIVSLLNIINIKSPKDIIDDDDNLRDKEDSDIDEEIDSRINDILDISINNVNDLINETVKDFYLTKSREDFYDHYRFIKKECKSINACFRKSKYINVDIAVRLAELSKKESKLDLLYNQIVEGKPITYKTMFNINDQL